MNAYEKFDDLFSEWTKLIDRFQKDVSGSLQQIRHDKEEVSIIRDEINQRLGLARIIADNNRIIISAPEVIIGNVDAEGVLKGGGVVKLRGSAVTLEGVGEGGSVSTRATAIRQTAVDPGPDGMEAVVHDGATISSQARNIVIDSNDATGVYTRAPKGTASGAGVSIHADKKVSIDASIDKKEFTDQITSASLKATKEIAQLTADSAKLRLKLQACFTEINALIKASTLLTADDYTAYASDASINDMSEKFSDAMTQMGGTMKEYFNTLSLLAEANRRKKALDKVKMSASDSSNFDKKLVGSSVAINGERVELSSRDGSGKPRTCQGSGVSVNALDITLSSTDDKIANNEKGHITLHAQNVAISTNNEKLDSSGKIESNGAGTFTVTSKVTDIKAVATEKEKGKDPVVKALEKEGKFSVNAQSVIFAGKDPEGKGVGKASVIAKEIEIAAVDSEKNKDTVKGLADKGSVTVVADTVNIGDAKDDKKMTKQLNLTADKQTSKLKTSLSVQQDEKAKIKAEGGKLTVEADKTEIKKDLTVGGKTELAKDVTAKAKLTAQQVEAKSKLKTPTLQA